MQFRILQSEFEEVLAQEFVYVVVCSLTIKRVRTEFWRAVVGWLSVVTSLSFLRWPEL